MLLHTSTSAEDVAELKSWRHGARLAVANPNLPFHEPTCHPTTSLDSNLRCNSIFPASALFSAIMLDLFYMFSV